MNPDKAIRINYAHYGDNCGSSANSGNTLSDIQNVCNGKASCKYRVDVGRIGDPKVGCQKAYEIKYTCGDSSDERTFSLDAEAHGKVVEITCSGISVENVHYGQNCGTSANSGSTLSHVQSLCNGKVQCSYDINHNIIGDPAVGCEKDYKLVYRCGSGDAKFCCIAGS